MGDLSSKLNNVSIGIANDAKNARKFRVIDVSLNVSSIYGHALVIRNSAGVPFACANIIKSGPMSMKASFEPSTHDGVSGAVSFSQESPYHPTIIDFALTGLNNKAKGIHVHQFPIPEPAPSNPCAAPVVGAHLNPYGINNKAANYPADGSGGTSILLFFSNSFLFRVLGTLHWRHSEGFVASWSLIQLVCGVRSSARSGFETQLR